MSFKNLWKQFASRRPSASCRQPAGGEAPRGPGSGLEGLEPRLLLSTWTAATLYSFTAGADGSRPASSLVIDSQGDRFGTTSGGGAHGCGTIFELAAGSNTPVTLYDFTGNFPAGQSGLTIDAEGNLYGMTSNGGGHGNGSIFELTNPGQSNSSFVTLYSFPGGSGGSANPTNALSLDAQGNLYGTTLGGGSYNAGAIFEIGAAGIANDHPAFTTLYSFTPDLTASGTETGTVDAGGNFWCALRIDSTTTVCELTQGRLAAKFYVPGAVTDLEPDGKGDVFGTTENGGRYKSGSIFEKVPGQALKTFYSATAAVEGVNGLVVDGQGNVYSTTDAGGAKGLGTAFEVSAAGSYAVLYSFTGVGSDGATPNAALAFDGQGHLFGVTANGGADGLGTVFELSPNCTINRAAGQDDPVNAGPINFTAVFSKPVTDFVAADVAVTGTAPGAKTVVITDSGDHQTFNVAVGGMTASGTVIATIKAGKVHDTTGGQVNAASTSVDDTVTYDILAPKVKINQAATQKDPSNLNPISFTAVFSKPVTDFVAADVAVTGTAPGTKTVAIADSGDHMTFTVTVDGMTGSGTVIATIPAGNVHDAADNANLASTSTDDQVTVLAISPTVTVTVAAGQANPTNVGPINFTVAFNEEVTGFTGASLQLAGTAPGTLTATVTGAGPTYNVQVTGMTGSGTVIVSVPAGAVHDPAGDPNVASTNAPATYDITPPTVTVNQAVTQKDPTNVGVINFTVVFDEPVTGFTPAGVTVGGTAPGTLVARVTGSGTTYNVAVRGMTASGTVTAGVSAGAAQDLAGNASLASTSTDNTVTYDIVAPTAAIHEAATQPDPTTQSPVNFTAVFSKPVVDFVAADIVITGTAPGAKTVVITDSGDHMTYNVAVAGMTHAGIVIATILPNRIHDQAGNVDVICVNTDHGILFSDHAPVVTSFAESVTHSLTLTFTAADFTAHFTDPDAGNTLQAVKIVSLPAVGSLKLSGAAVTAGQVISAADLDNLTYAASSTAGQTSFTWDAFDGGLYAAALAKVNLTIL